MFEINKEKLEQENAEQMARKMFAQFLSQQILESDTAPESMKLSVLVMNKSEEVHECITKLIKHFVNPKKRANVDTMKKVLEYLALVEVGIQQFIETTPFVAEEETEEED